MLEEDEKFEKFDPHDVHLIHLKIPRTNTVWHDGQLKKLRSRRQNQTISFTSYCKMSTYMTHNSTASLAVDYRNFTT